MLIWLTPLDHPTWGRAFDALCLFPFSAVANKVSKDIGVGNSGVFYVLPCFYFLPPTFLTELYSEVLCYIFYQICVFSLSVSALSVSWLWLPCAINSAALYLICLQMFSLLVLLWEGAWTLLYNSVTVTSSPLSLIFNLNNSHFFHSWLQKFCVLLILLVPVSGLLCYFSYMLRNGMLFVLYSISSGGYNKCIKQLNTSSVLRFSLFCEARLLNMIKCNDACIKVTWISLGHKVCI